MNIKQLSKRAIEIRHKYSELEKKKTGREWSNLNLMEGFVGDIGDLMKLVMAKEGVRNIENVDKKLAHELADCLWSILVLSEKYGVDIEQSFLKTMNELEEQIAEQNKS
ncbi:MAG TPA: MazG nucleotide pyrophosphohydrolase domain-containing protein [Candidatus Levybacteria bacterium]|nr:MazG nucleotide pyrophosphohydrolase domain-containing protein [Candidatus Levybacteria bacterium]